LIISIGPIQDIVDKNRTNYFASDTEPVMRLIVEAKDKCITQKDIDAVLKIRDKLLG
jgi:phosphomannomutase